MESYIECATKSDSDSITLAFLDPAGQFPLLDFPKCACVSKSHVIHIRQLFYGTWVWVISEPHPVQEPGLAVWT